MGCEEIGGHEGRWSRVKDLLRSVWDLDDFFSPPEATGSQECFLGQSLHFIGYTDTIVPFL